MDQQTKTKPPGSSSFRAAEVNTNSDQKIAEDSEKRKPKRWSLVIEAKGEILASFLPLEPADWPRNFAKFGVTSDGNIFINPAILAPGAKVSALVSGVAIAIKGGPILALSWAKANYPEQAEMLHELEMYVRGSASNVFISSDEDARQGIAKEGEANGNK